MERPYSVFDPIPVSNVDVKFYLQIEGELIEVEPGILAALCENRNGCLNHFIAGYLHGYKELLK